MTRVAKSIDQIKDSNELKYMEIEDLNALAGELRERIITTVSTNGGHLASNLGTVELTLALLHNFDAIEDRVVWDVGHQSYSWKILTGRSEAFSTLRQEGGLSGFPKREESAADAFNTGHSSTSISAALGISRGLALQGLSGRAIAVIGDGALTGGLAYEALNNIEASDNLIVIINDNQMSIDSNVGSISRHLNRIRISRKYLKVKSGVDKILQRIPLLGRPVMKLIRWTKTQIRRAAIEEQSFFENLGFEYYGPIDGHNIAQLDKALKVIKAKNSPVILHILTQKGRGYQPAENKPSLYHGVAPFEVEVGVVSKTAAESDSGFLGDCTSFTAAFSQSLMSLAEKDPSIVGITAAMASGTGLTPFAEAYPDRFYDVGIAEQHAVTMAAGLATTGLKPVVAIYSSFLQRALDQVIHDAVLQKLHVVFCVDRAGIVGDDGETHQGIYDVSFLNALPGITIMMPGDYRSLYDMMVFALYQCKGPVVIRYPRGSGEHSSTHALRRNLRPSLPAAETLVQGRDVVIAALGSMTSVALEAAVRLRSENISASVIDVRCLKPLDTDSILAAAMNCGYLVTVEEQVINGGLAQNLALKISERNLPIILQAHSIGDHPVLQAGQQRARDKEGLSADQLVLSVRKMVSKSMDAVE